MTRRDILKLLSTPSRWDFIPEAREKPEQRILRRVEKRFAEADKWPGLAHGRKL